MQFRWEGEAGDEGCIMEDLESNIEIYRLPAAAELDGQLSDPWVRSKELGAQEMYALSRQEGRVAVIRY